MRRESIRPEYVEFIPKTLDDAALYISKKFRTASHRCCCGCGTKIVTPLRETEYQLFERGDRVSLEPSIGNWNHPCQAHYWIKNNRVIWAERWTRAQITRTRAHDDAAREAYFANSTWPWWRHAWDRIWKWFS